jgi:hypothetical protein
MQLHPPVNQLNSSAGGRSDASSQAASGTAASMLLHQEGSCHASIVKVTTAPKQQGMQ